MIVWTKIYRIILLIILVVACENYDKNQLQKERTAILNTLLEKYSSSSDSLAVYNKSLTNISEYITKDQLQKEYFNDDSLSISQKDLEAWRKQWQNYRPVQWKEWGWHTDYLISRGEFPEYYEYSVPPPGFEIKTFVKIVYFSLPLVGKNHALVSVATSRGKHSWVVVLIIMEKKNKRWIYHSSKGVLTS